MISRNLISRLFIFVEDATKWLAVTQFETTGARKSFPCFDEPEKKAQFKVSLGHSEDMVARSNMDLIANETIPETGMIMDTFDTSVKMPTYLVAFLVADFGFTENKEDSTYTIWHQKSKDGQADYAAEIGKKYCKQILTLYKT